jgi:hypothetical protein
MVLAAMADFRRHGGMPSLILFFEQIIDIPLSLTEGKIPPDEPPVLPPIPVVIRDDKRRLGFSTPQASKKFREREWDRGMDFDLMPPPGSSKKAGTSMDLDPMIDPNEPTYCICHQVCFENYKCSYNFHGTYICNVYINHFFFHKCSLNNFHFCCFIFQVSYGDMIACDNENVSRFGVNQL